MKTPDDLRLEASVTRLSGRLSQGDALDKCADAWQAEIERADGLLAELEELDAEWYEDYERATQANAELLMQADALECERDEARQVARRLLRVVRAYRAWDMKDCDDPTLALTVCLAHRALSPALRRLVEG